MTRLMLETRHHSFAYFITLTYSEESVPPDGLVRKSVLSAFMKRLRQRVYPDVVRFFGVGEYGGHSGRPHYHVLVFGTCLDAHVVPTKKEPEAWKHCACPVCASWRKGGVDVGSVTQASCAYVVSYICKDQRTHGKEEQEFALMSRRPGIGFAAVEGISEASVEQSTGLLRFGGEAPRSLRVGEVGRRPLGRYLVGKLREKVGVRHVVEEMRAMRNLQLAASLRDVSARVAMERRRVQGGRNASARSKIASSKRGFGV